MIYSLTGKIIKKTLNAVVICCGGVGYYAQCPASVAGALPGVGKETTLYTVMSVTENDVSLYGFATEEQQACFEMLTAVSGVGPKVGLAILSVMEPDRVALAISAGDHKAFKAASGVRPKLAQRIVLELKDKVAAKELTLKISDAAFEHMLGKCFTKEYGAREADRVIAHELKPLIMREILFGKRKKGSTLAVDFNNGVMAVRNSSKSQSADNA